MLARNTFRYRKPQVFSDSRVVKWFDRLPLHALPRDTGYLTPVLLFLACLWLFAMSAFAPVPPSQGTPGPGQLLIGTVCVAATHGPVHQFLCLVSVYQHAAATPVWPVSIPSDEVADSARPECGAQLASALSRTPAPWRLVPTPCRSGLLLAGEPALASDILFLADGPTLLEDAVRSPDNQAMMEATILLEVLFQHHADSSCAGLVAPQQIKLAQAIPLTPHQESALELEAILPHTFSPADLHYTCDWLDADLTALLNDAHVPLEFRTMFVNFETWFHAGQPHIDAVHIYTDGSATANLDAPRPASWAFSAWAVCGTRTLLLGYAASQATPTDTPYNVGEIEATALTAEYLAMIWALSWAAEFGVGYATVFCFFYDAQSAGHGVFGWASLPAGNYAALAHLAVYLRQYLEARSHVEHRHVHSHCGHPANEFVDQLAKQAGRQSPDHWQKCLPLWPVALSRHPYRAWAWATLHSHPDLPAFFAYDIEAMRMQQLPRTDITPPDQGQRTRRLSQGEVSYNISAISYNVLTLRDPTPKQLQQLPVGLRMLGRKAILKDSLARFRPLLVGLQETRLPEACTQPYADYIILQAPADSAGTGGCALWVSRHRPYATQSGTSLCFLPKHATVISHSPRHLCATLIAPRLSLMVVVLHAPSLSKTPANLVREFWRDRATELARRPEGSDFLLLADTNARVGSVVTPHVGGHAFEDETTAGQLLHDF